MSKKCIVLPSYQETTPCVETKTYSNYLTAQRTTTVSGWNNCRCCKPFINMTESDWKRHHARHVPGGKTKGM